MELNKHLKNMGKSVTLSLSPVQPKFSVGTVLATEEVCALIELVPGDVARGLQRHLAGIWGNVSSSCKQANNKALALGFESFGLLSLFDTDVGEPLFIHTVLSRGTTRLYLKRESYSEDTLPYTPVELRP
jgi:hypothetical protein